MRVAGVHCVCWGAMRLVPSQVQGLCYVDWYEVGAESVRRVLCCVDWYEVVDGSINSFFSPFPTRIHLRLVLKRLGSWLCKTSSQHTLSTDSSFFEWTLAAPK